MTKIVLGLVIAGLVVSVAAQQAWAQGAGEKKAEAPAKDASPPAGAPAVPPAPPKPAAEMDTLKFFVGKWKCDGKQFASPFGAEHPFTGSATANWEADKFWQGFTYEEKKSKVHRGLLVHGTWGYDQGAKQFVRAAGANDGAWDTASAPGWQGDKLVWTGEFSGLQGKTPFHHTFMKKSDKEWSHAMEIKTPDGRWVPVSEGTCKK